MMDRLTELKVFLAIVDEGSFAAASRALRRSAPTVTRIISDLEARIGAKLLDRSSRRCAPTEAGRRLAQSARTIIEEYDRAISVTSGERHSARGHLRVTAPYLFGREQVAPAVLKFLDRQPEISIELDLSDRPTDVEAEGFDMAVRIGGFSSSSLKIRKLGVVRRLIVASPEYLERRGVPKTPECLAEHEVLFHGEIGRSPWRFSSLQGQIAVSLNGRYSVNQADAALAAARAGRGLVTALSYQVHDDLKAGRLVTVLDEFAGETHPVHLAWPDGRDQLLRLRLLIDFLVDALVPLPILS